MNEAWSYNDGELLLRGQFQNAMKSIINNIFQRVFILFVSSGIKLKALFCIRQQPL